jgi:uncharacterized protein (TIGR02284 family)
MDTYTITATLNRLIQTAKDSETGFKTAADGLQDPRVKALFTHYSRQRAEMTHELQAEVRRYGGAPETAGSIAAAAHRGWINVKAAVTGKDDASMIAEAERVEDSAIKAYREALRQPLPSSTLALVREQAMKIQDAADRVRVLEKADKATAR